MVKAPRRGPSESAPLPYVAARYIVGEVVDFAFEPIGLVVEGDFEVEEAAIAVELLRVILGLGIRRQQAPIGNMARRATHLAKIFSPALTSVVILARVGAGWLSRYHSATSRSPSEISSQ